MVRILIDLPARLPGRRLLPRGARALRRARRSHVRRRRRRATSRALSPTRTWSSPQALSDDELARAAALRWLSSVAAGLDEIITPALLARGIAITNASGVHGPNIAEHVLAMMLMFTRGMPRLFRAQLARRWERNLKSRSDGPGELTGKTLLIVGPRADRRGDRAARAAVRHAHRGAQARSVDPTRRRRRRRRAAGRWTRSTTPFRAPTTSA